MDDITHIIEPLNGEQRAAVTAETGHALVLAGAGSGKTRVLAHRVAWLVATGQARPSGILAVTFTNKASREMRGRIETILQRPIGGMWVGTFHGIAHRFLRTHPDEAGLGDSFQIADSDDQLRLVRRLMREMNLDEGSWPPKQAQAFINRHKEQGVRVRHLPEPGDLWERRMTEVYRAYESACAASGLADFAELLLRAWEVLRESPETLALYQERFGHLLVDEFQDTNAIQYAWISLLAEIGGGSSWWATTISRSTVGVAPASRTSRSSRAIQRRHDLQAGGELPLHGQDSRRGERGHRQQRGTAGQEPPHVEVGRRADLHVLRLQRRDEARFVVGRIEQSRGEGWRARRPRDPVPDERPVAGDRGCAAHGRDGLPHTWRAAVLRAGRDQGRGGLPAARRIPRRRCGVRAGGERACPRGRCAERGPRARARAVPGRFPVGGGGRDRE